MVIEDYRTPGQLIEALLQKQGWTQRLLAIILGVDISLMNRIISGKKAIDAKMAILLLPMLRSCHLINKASIIS